VTRPPAVDRRPGHHWIVDWRQRTAPHGARIVRAFDVRTGKQAWSFDPLPAGLKTLARRCLVGDRGRSRTRLIFVPTAAPVRISMGATAPATRLCEFCRGDASVDRQGAVGLSGGHHDLWDYDARLEPMLGELQRHARRGVTTKSGTCRTGPHDREIAAAELRSARYRSHAVPGEDASPTQPSRCMTR